MLAHGSRVDTYDVVDLARDCRAVLKVVRPDRAHEERVVDALRVEGTLLTTLSHPHLVRGYDLLEEPRPAVVLETVPGSTLAALVDDGAMSSRDTALVGRQLASVLGYLHRHGWLHLDVKPENVVVQEGRVVLIDLGVASRPGRLERAVGTEGYAAPEQAAGGTVGPAADVRGLGATLWECLTREAPGDAPDLDVLRGRGPLGDLVADCLRPDPSLRPSVREVAGRLDAVLAAPDRLRGWWSSRRRWRR
nr:serine/threonine-protein kinase [Nocardioides flavescens]